MASTNEEKTETDPLPKKYPFAVDQNEAENFMKDVIKEATKIHKIEKSNSKSLFLKSFLFGFILFIFVLALLYILLFLNHHVIKAF